MACLRSRDLLPHGFKLLPDPVLSRAQLTQGDKNAT